MSKAGRHGGIPRALTLALFALLALPGADGGPRAADAPDYRLAGIVAVGSDRLLAVIEMPDGRQGLFRSGDSLGSGRIRDITRTDVRVEMNGEELLLSLRGNPKLSAAVPAAVADVVDEEAVYEEPGEDATVRKQPLFYEDTVRLLTSVRAGAGDKPTAGAPAAAGTGNAASADPLTARLNELLGVPPGAQIAAVDGSPVSSPQDVIDKIVPLLGAGRAVRLSVTGAGELQVIFITPVDEEAGLE